MGLPATFFVVTQFIGAEVVPSWDANLKVQHIWMTRDQVWSLSHEGWEIGAHTRTHANLGEVFGEEAWEGTLCSRIELEEKLCAPVDLFAYPHGREKDIFEESREIVKAATAG